MTLQEEFKIVRIRSGQPRPYADHERVYRVEHWHYNELTGEGSIWDWPSWAHYDEDDTESYNVDFVELAKGIARVTRYPLKADLGRDDWHMSYLDYAKVVEPGVVEIRVVEPYID